MFASKGFTKWKGISKERQLINPHSIGRKDWFLYAMRGILYINMTARVVTLFLRELMVILLTNDTIQKTQAGGHE